MRSLDITLKSVSLFEQITKLEQILEYLTVLKKLFEKKSKFIKKSLKQMHLHNVIAPYTKPFHVKQTSNYNILM